MWDASDAKIKDILQDLIDMEAVVQAEGWGGTIEIWAGRTAYQHLAGLVASLSANSKVDAKVTKDGVNVGGYIVKLRNEKYPNPQTKAMTPVVAENKIVMIGMDGGHRLIYCAVDDLDANLQPLPLFVKPIELKNPSGIDLVAESKPLPAPNVKAICWAHGHRHTGGTGGIVNYCSASDVADWVFQAYLDAAENQAPGILERSMAAVAREIDEALAGRFVLPLTVVPETIRRISAVLAGYRSLGGITSLVATEGGTNNEFLYIQRLATQAQKELDSLRAGKLDNMLAEAGAEPVSDSGSVLVQTAPRIFGPDTWEGF